MDDNHTHHPEFDDGADPAFDARARAAGRAVREPAPADGLGRVRSAKRRRTAIQAGGVTAIAVLAAGGIFAIVRSGDDNLQSSDSPATVTTGDAEPATEPATETSGPSATDSVAADTTPSETTGDGTTNSIAPPVDSVAPEPTEDGTGPTTAASVEYVPAGQYAGPTFDERTTAIADPLADGLYFSASYTSDGTATTFQLIQRIRGQACIDEFGDGADDACASDSGTISEPSATITMTADTADTSVIFFDNADFVAYRVPADEFIRLAAGQAPSNGAPDGYEWIPWGTYVTIQDGRVVAAHQQFSS